jgi:hypothetical protein
LASINNIKEVLICVDHGIVNVILGYLVELGGVTGTFTVYAGKEKIGTGWGVFGLQLDESGRGEGGVGVLLLL